MSQYKNNLGLTLILVVFSILNKFIKEMIVSALVILRPRYNAVTNHTNNIP